MVFAEDPPEWIGCQSPLTVSKHPPKLQHIILADTRQILYMFKPLRAVRQCYYILSNRRCCQRNRTLSKRLSFKGGLYITTPPLSILQVYVLHDYSFWHIFILVNTCRLIFFFFHRVHSGADVPWRNHSNEKTFNMYIRQLHPGSLGCNWTTHATWLLMYACSLKNTTISQSLHILKVKCSQMCCRGSVSHFSCTRRNH